VSNGKSKKSQSKKTKLSTIVEPFSLDAFYARYADICKSGTVALKPRDRRKKKAKAKKQKVGTVAGGTS
jgi:signal recognition particle subunit SRP14